MATCKVRSRAAKVDDDLPVQVYWLFNLKKNVYLFQTKYESF